MDFEKLRYAFSALPKRFVQPKVCPSCGTRTSSRADWKGFHELRRCSQCALLFRWPTESATEMEAFYQRQYKQPGLTTDLPDNAALAALLETGFKGSNKDFSRVIALFQAIGIAPRARILDFGANWGYGVWQFRQAGYETVGYELSRPRAEFSERLGVKVYTDWQDVMAAGPFDVAFSSHVLEHTPDPAEAIRHQLSVLQPNGFLIALFPNGSSAFRIREPQAFHKLWGRVHPVMLDVEFVSGSLRNHMVFQGSLCDEDLGKLSRWDRRKHEFGNVGTSELLVVAKVQDDSHGFKKTEPANEATTT